LCAYYSILYGLATLGPIEPQFASKEMHVEYPGGMTVFKSAMHCSNKETNKQTNKQTNKKKSLKEEEKSSQLNRKASSKFHIAFPG